MSLILPHISSIFVDFWVIGYLEKCWLIDFRRWILTCWLIDFRRWILICWLIDFRRWILICWLIVELNVMIFVEFIVKVSAGQYKFVELKPREINFTF